MSTRVALSAGIVVLFIAAVMILLHVFPGPRRPVDYLVVGTLATFVCILVVFIMVVTTSEKRDDFFFKRRK
jgi:hypothetical protein